MKQGRGYAEIRPVDWVTFLLTAWTALLIYSHFRLRPQATLASPFSEQVSSMLPKHGVPAPADFEWKPSVNATVWSAKLEPPNPGKFVLYENKRIDRHAPTPPRTQTHWNIYNQQ